MATAIVDTERLEMKLGEYVVGAATALSDPGVLPRVQDYRRGVGSRMYPLGKDDIDVKIPNADFHVSRKIDGEFTVLVYREGELFTINPGGTIRAGLPWHAEAKKLLADADVKEAMIVGELYVHNDERRPRVHDVVAVARQPQSQEELQRVRFAAFDIISLNNEAASNVFDETWRTIDLLFSSGELIHPVEAKTVKSTGEIKDLFEKWVEGEDAEGLVVRSDSAGTFKIKPRHTLDAAIIGFTESTDDRAGMMHDLLLAVHREDGTLHVLTRVGGGFSEEQRREMLSDLKDMVVDSEYVEVNSDNVAYQMIRPELVAEISCLDLVSQNTRGGPVNRMVLDFDKDSGQYRVMRRLPLCSVISPQFVRIREDKNVHPDEIRIAQVAERVEVAMVDRNAKQLQLPISEVLRREVFTKEAKGQTMVRKFVMWKTNKADQGDEFPAYVLHYTDFSPNRKTPMASDVRVSNSETQIVGLFEQLKEANIKKGWQTHAANAEPAVVEAKNEGPARKKKAAAKKTVKKVELPDEGETAVKPAATKKKAAKKSAAKKTVKKKAAQIDDDASSVKAPAKKKAAPKKKAAKKKATKK